MRKKLKLLAVVLCLAVFGIMALGSSSSDDEEKKEIVTNSDGSVVSDGVSDNTDVTIAEQVLLDQNGIVITAQEYVNDSIWGEGIKMVLENNSDKDVTVGCSALIVNNYMITDLFVSDVAVGKKANETMWLSSSELKAAGIDSVGQVEIYFHIYDSSTYDTIYDSECVTIQTSQYENMDTTPDDAGVELYNANGIRIVGKTVDENSFWGTAILLYCENTSGRNVGISVNDMSINGFMMNPLFSTTIYNGKMAIDDITILSSDLEENGIESIENVELKFHIYDTDSYETIADSEPITFSAQ
ncbi:MAG: hypothetical protein IJA27_06590 [Lachnospiraceae bacterium]|nr:hypothetical protein [Lachnospiraceae bacterium]